MFKSELPLELRSKSTNQKILVKKRRDFYGNKLIDSKLIQFLFPTAYVETPNIINLFESWCRDMIEISRDGH